MRSKYLYPVDTKSYAIQWSADGRKVTKCGVRIDSQKRNITQWRMVDENGVKDWESEKD